MSTHETSHLFGHIDLEHTKGSLLSFENTKETKWTVICDLPLKLGHKDHHVQNNQREMLNCTAVREGMGNKCHQ